MSSFFFIYSQKFRLFRDHSPRPEPPKFLKKIGDCEIYPGMTGRFTACASGYPEPEYEWFRGTNRLYPTNRIEIEKEGSGLARYLFRV